MGSPSPFSPEDLDEWLQFAGELAGAAAAVTTHYFRRNPSTQIKADASPVTLADQETEQVLREMIREYYPHHGILGEEMGSENMQADFCWVLDPIDGTRAFMTGIPTYVTLIGLAYQGRPILGIIDQPHLRERWSAAAGRPTQYNGEPVKPIMEAPETLAEATMGTTASLLFPDHAMPAFLRLNKATRQTINGGDGYLYGRLASGAPHLVCEYGLKPHDFCALVPVIEQAGGKVTDWQGQPFTLQSDGSMLAAVTAELHALALAVLQN